MRDEVLKRIQREVDRVMREDDVGVRRVYCVRRCAGLDGQLKISLLGGVRLFGCTGRRMEPRTRRYESRRSEEEDAFTARSPVSIDGRWSRLGTVEARGNATVTACVCCMLEIA